MSDYELNNTDTSENNTVQETISWPTARFVVKRNIDYKWNENIHLENIQQYIDTTYSAHYATSKIQATEVIQDAGYGLEFFLGNILKYALRFGKKDGFNKKDLLKIVHYAVMALEVHERQNSDGNNS